jgi:hypothetical protein
MQTGPTNLVNASIGQTDGVGQFNAFNEADNIHPNFDGQKNYFAEMNMEIGHEDLGALFTVLLSFPCHLISSFLPMVLRPPLPRCHHSCPNSVAFVLDHVW